MNIFSHTHKIVAGDNIHLLDRQIWASLSCEASIYRKQIHCSHCTEVDTQLNNSSYNMLFLLAFQLPENTMAVHSIVIQLGLNYCPLFSQCCGFGCFFFTVCFLKIPSFKTKLFFNVYKILGIKKTMKQVLYLVRQHWFINNLVLIGI